MSISITFHVPPFDQQWIRRTELRLRRAFDRASRSVARRSGKPEDLAEAYGRVIHHARALKWVV